MPSGQELRCFWWIGGDFNAGAVLLRQPEIYLRRVLSIAFIPL